MLNIAYNFFSSFFSAIDPSNQIDIFILGGGGIARCIENDNFFRPLTKKK